VEKESQERSNCRVVGKKSARIRTVASDAFENCSNSEDLLLEIF
jgi:hypothetical protein